MPLSVLSLPDDDFAQLPADPVYAKVAANLPIMFARAGLLASDLTAQV